MRTQKKLTADEYTNRGNSFFDEDKFEQAVEDYTNAIEQDSKKEKAFYNRGNAYLAMKEFDKAISDYTQAINLNPRFSQAFKNRSVAYDFIGKIEQARLDCKEAIMLNPKESGTYVNLAGILIKLNKFDEAITACNTAIELDAKSDNVYYYRGLAYQNKNEEKKAELNYKKALGDTHQIEIPLLLAMFFADKGDAQNTIELLNKVIELKPDSAIAYNNRGSFYSGQGEVALALSDFHVAAKLDTECEIIRENLKLALLADAALQKTVPNEPDNSSAIQDVSNINIISAAMSNLTLSPGTEKEWTFIESTDNEIPVPQLPPRKNSKSSKSKGKEEQFINLAVRIQNSLDGRETFYFTFHLPENGKLKLTDIKNQLPQLAGKIDFNLKQWCFMLNGEEHKKRCSELLEIDCGLVSKQFLEITLQSAPPATLSNSRNGSYPPAEQSNNKNKEVTIDQCKWENFSKYFREDYLPKILKAEGVQFHENQTLLEYWTHLIDKANYLEKFKKYSNCIETIFTKLEEVKLNAFAVKLKNKEVELFFEKDEYSLQSLDSFSIEMVRDEIKILVSDKSGFRNPKSELDDHGPFKFLRACKFDKDTKAVKKYNSSESEEYQNIMQILNTFIAEAKKKEEKSLQRPPSRRSSRSGVSNS